MAGYIRYVLKNIEPLSISDDSTSQSGQTSTLRYIPGTTVRGMIIHALAEDGAYFAENKKNIFRGLKFLNAYPMEGEHELVPSPKGFYEDKKKVVGKKEVENVVLSGEFTDGNKRAALGRFCYFEKDTINYYSLGTSALLKIKIGEKKEQKVFRSDYLLPGNIFVGYIALADDNDEEKILSVLNQKRIMLGNGRSQGFGKCKLIKAEYVTKMPYASYAVKEACENFCYLMLISHTTMRNEIGEFCGIDLRTLENKMGVSNLKIEFASSSIVQVRGYNRTWGSKIPSVPMYEQGSVFKLSFQGSASFENLNRVMQEGIGVRREEGFGRVLFVNDNYVNLKFKNEIDATIREIKEQQPIYAEDQNILQVVAKVYYRQVLEKSMQKTITQGTKRGKLSNSQVGTVLSILEKNKYHAEDCKKILKEYFDHAMKKEQNKKQNDAKNFVSFRKLKEHINNILLDDTDDMFFKEISFDKKTIFGVETKGLMSKEDMFVTKVNYFIDLIKYEQKGSDKDDQKNI